MFAVGSETLGWFKSVLTSIPEPPNRSKSKIPFNMYWTPFHTVSIYLGATIIFQTAMIDFLPPALLFGQERSSDASDKVHEERTMLVSTCRSGSLHGHCMSWHMKVG